MVSPSLAPGGSLSGTPGSEIETLETELLLEGVKRRYGYDFRDYARPSLTRQLRKAAVAEGLSTLTGLLDRLLHSPDCMNRLLRTISIHVTAMFRDPTFYRTLRTKVCPWLATYPYFRVWIAGCSTGEEAYSVAILLHEAGLSSRASIYATDSSHTVLDRAKAGIFSVSAMQEHTQNYLAAGGQADFSRYYTARYDRAIFKEALRKNLIFAEHNLGNDESFNEFHLILCRNVLIYFNDKLQDRVHGLFYRSLHRRGLLALGQRESLRATSWRKRYEDFDAEGRIYRKTV